MRPGDKMCNFYPRGPTSCVLAAGWGVGAHSGSSHILTRCLNPRLEPNAVRFLLSFLHDRCAGMKMIRPAGGCFAATFSSGFLRSGPPPQAQLSFLTQYYALSRDFLRFRNTATIFRSLLFSKVIKELPQRCNSEQTEKRSVLEQTLSQCELGLINFPSIASPPLFLASGEQVSGLHVASIQRRSPGCAKGGNVNLGQIHQVERQRISARLACFLRRSFTLQRRAQWKRKRRQT